MTVVGHLEANTTELGGGLLHDDLHPVASPLTERLVLGGELSGKLAAAGGSLGASVGGLLVVLLHSLVEHLAGVLGVGLDLSGVGSHVLVGLSDTSVGGRGNGGHGTLLGGDRLLQVGSGLLLVLLDQSTDLLGASNVRVVALVLELC